MQLTRGEQFINSLKDGRKVWLEGKEIEVTTHAAFHGTLNTISRLFTMLDEPELSNQIGFYDTAQEKIVHNAFLLPREQADLRKRAAAFRIWAEHTNGVMSRLSDYARSRLTGWYATKERYHVYDKHFGDKISRYYEEAKAKDLFLTAVQREPQVNRSQAIGDDPDAILRVIGKNSEGLIVRGAKMIATAGPYSNDFIVYPVTKIPENHPEYAHMMIVPANSKGLHMMCRESFAELRNHHDYPISSRYDEMDAVLFFDDVVVPWERVLLHDNPEALWQIRMNEASSSLAYHQSIIRLQVKLEFVTGLACAIAESIGVNQFLNIQEKLGELVNQVQTIKGLIIASEVEAKADEFGNLIPAFTYIETARNLGSRYYPRALEIIQTIGAGGFFQVPSTCSEIEGPLGTYIQTYLQGASLKADEKVKLFKLAWDLVGSPLASRHKLYEQFYAGDPVRNLAGQYVNFDKDKMIGEVFSMVRSS
ncbi:4-hydroxyphenylacetate 3-hydroxylase [Paenibacillus sp. SYP-B3998]|uniref:4-hydroxyphenylacetate 3-hydroxylase n=1 Tax=Paenibacillus sp. SYP-B3998 TaxID=2678564 RepID=A0A6G3ZY56_9BACL|nr:4-hydroxyphenylacetate 3-hydroxylase N-terminal domain-containing protein [Paenibacillus sp. SYP-B3998]NEW07072.1 4-hydroxyphenylacetate 3-hydroxylase [Paenibacillus sp. SYP-B3998]